MNHKYILGNFYLDGAYKLFILLTVIFNEFPFPEISLTFDIIIHNVEYK